MSKIEKTYGLDRFDAHPIKKPSFIHDNYYVSKHSRDVHTPSSWGYNADFTSEFKMGIQHKMFKVSGYGIMVDSTNVGKSDML